MNRAGAIRTFHRDVILKLRSAATTPVNISHIFFYSYDSSESSPKCDQVKDSSMPNVAGLCVDGVIDPTTGTLLSDVGTAVAGRARSP